MKTKERILKVLRGEMVDKIPFVPRLDLWWLANLSKGTLPKKYEGMMPDDISRAEGFPLYHMVPNFADVTGLEDILHRSIGLYNFRKSVYRWSFSENVEVIAEEVDGLNKIEYRTPIGTVKTIGGLTEQMKKSGASLGWVLEHAIKKREDYKVMTYLFENIEVYPQYEAFEKYIDEVGDDGVVVAFGPTLGASPMHMIQKELIDTTQFYFEYKDNYREMKELAESIENYFNKVLSTIVESPAEVIMWGANYDEMITYPTYFEKEILPWLQKASSTLNKRGILVGTHTDGENEGLIDLIKKSGVNFAESVTPYPMTKVRIEEYYHRWKDNLTIMGGIPETILLKESTSDQDFESYLDNMFNSVAPGDKLILGTADSTPPDADFDRLRRIAERVEIEGRLPLKGKITYQVKEPVLQERQTSKEPYETDSAIRDLQGLVLEGNAEDVKNKVQLLLDQGRDASEILNNGLIKVMESITEQFKRGEVFIPEVLITARAFNEVLPVMEPYFTEEHKGKVKKFLIGTVEGDLHDIGKNIVAIMMRGANFEVRDIGINVPVEEFIDQIRNYKPDIVGISSLLTTTMPEMKKIIEGLIERGLRDSCKIMVGGAPVTLKYAQDIGADAYARNAGEAVEVAKQIIS